MKHNKKNHFIAISFIIFLGFFSCNKEKTQHDLSPAEKNIAVLIASIDVFLQMDYVVKDTMLLANDVDITTPYGNAVINNGSQNFPKKLVISYDENFLTYDNIKRKGIIKANIIGTYRNWWLIDSIYTDNYNFANIISTGNIIHYNLGRNFRNNLYYKWSFSNFTSGDDFVILDGNLFFEWIKGIQSEWEAIYDDEYLITGSYQGKISNSNYFKLNIIEPLQFKIGGGVFYKGALEIIQPDSPKITIDFNQVKRNGLIRVIIYSNEYFYRLNQIIQF